MCGRQIQTTALETESRGDRAPAESAGFANGALAGNTTGANRPRLPFRRERDRDRQSGENDPQERGQMDQQGSGDGFGGSAERCVSPAQSTPDRGRCQSLGGASGLFETQRFRLCCGGLDEKRLGSAYTGTRPG